MNIFKKQYKIYNISSLANFQAYYIESTQIGIQINSSSRFKTNGGVLPYTLTFTIFRYEKL